MAGRSSLSVSARWAGLLLGTEPSFLFCPVTTEIQSGLGEGVAA